MFQRVRQNFSYSLYLPKPSKGVSRLCPFPLLNCKKGNVLTVGAAAGIQRNLESRNWQKLEASGLSPASKPKLCLQLQIQILQWWIPPSGKSPFHKRKVVRRCTPVEEWWVTHKCIWKSFSLHFFQIHRTIISLRICPFESFYCALQQCACSCCLWILGVSSRVIFSVLFLASISAYKESWKNHMRMWVGFISVCALQYIFMHLS